MPTRFWSYSLSALYPSARGTEPLYLLPTKRTRSWTTVGRLSVRPSACHCSRACLNSTKTLLKRQQYISILERFHDRNSQRCGLQLWGERLFLPFSSLALQKNYRGRNLRWNEKHEELTAKHMKRLSVHDIDTDGDVYSVDWVTLVDGQDNAALSEISSSQDSNKEGQRWGTFGRTIDADINPNRPKGETR